MLFSVLLGVGIYARKRTESGRTNEALVFAALTKRMDNHCVRENRSFVLIRQLFLKQKEKN